MPTNEDHARFLRCIGEPTRLQILKLLAEKNRCVGELVTIMDKEQSLISHHLKALKECNIVTDKQEAQKVYYKITDDRLARLILESETLMKKLLLEPRVRNVLTRSTEQSLNRDEQAARGAFYHLPSQTC